MTRSRVLGIVLVTLFLIVAISDVQARKRFDDDAFELTYDKYPGKVSYDGTRSKRDSVDDDDYYDDKPDSSDYDDDMDEESTYFRYDDDYPEASAFSNDFVPEFRQKSSKKIELDGDSDLFGDDDSADENSDDEGESYEEQEEGNADSEEDGDRVKRKRLGSRRWYRRDDEDLNVSPTDDEDEDYYRSKPRRRYSRRYDLTDPSFFRNERRRYKPSFEDRRYDERDEYPPRGYGGRYSDYESRQRNFGRQNDRFERYPRNRETVLFMDYDRDLGRDIVGSRNSGRGPRRGNSRFAGYPGRNNGYESYPMNQGLGNAGYGGVYPMNQGEGFGMDPGSAYWRSIEGLGSRTGEPMNAGLRGKNSDMSNEAQEVRNLLMKLLSEDNQRGNRRKRI